MNIHETTRLRKNSFSFVRLSIAIVAICMGLFISLLPSRREYFPVGVSAKDNDDNDAGAKGEEDFFFNARKNIHTNAMDYSSMAAAALADRAMTNARNTHAAMATGVPNYNWMSMGPTNVGGRTRAILIDNTDPTHQTLFAGGVSGGIWKSTNGGATWDNAAHAVCYSLNDTLSNMNVSCITQDATGAIYIGTGEGFQLFSEGEGFSSALLGGGIFKSTDDGATWNILPKTVPSPTNNANIAWAYTDRLATRPDKPQTVYAATNFGIYISRDGGATWRSAFYYNNAQKKLVALTSASANSLDLKISNDGSVIVAFVNSYGYYCYPQTVDSIFTQIKTTGAGHLGTTTATRIEFAISPTNPDRIYASVIIGGTFGGNKSSGIFMTMNAKTNGGYWHEIAQGGGGFNPYAIGGGSGDQSTYDNTLGVPPANEAQVLCGGTTLFEWSGASLTDTIGSWQPVSHYGGSLVRLDPLWIHPDEHTIVFDTKNPQTVYVGCDGGIFKCTDWYITYGLANSPKAVPGAISNLQFGSMNRNYNVTQYYTISFSPMLTKSRVAMSINNGAGIDSATQNLGVGGGTQDNGSPYINGGSFFGHSYPNDGLDMSGGDGAGSVVSTLDPNVAYFCADYGSLERENNLTVLSSTTSAYTQTKGYNLGGNIDSVWQHASQSNGACFVFPVALYENAYDTLTHDSLLYTAPDTIVAGKTIFPVSATANIAYPYKLTKTLPKGESIMVPDRVVARLAVGFAGSDGGIWITGQAASTNVVVWMPIAGPLSKPTAFSDNSPVHAIAWTPDGNTLFAGSEDGSLFRFSNINSIIANNYKSGALWSNAGGKGIVDTTNRVVSNNLTSNLGASGRDILSISVDPANGNNVLVTLGNYGDAAYVYFSSNALDATPTFTKVQGNLPAMPVYGSILDIIDSTGHYITNSAMVATEHGIYTTSNVTSGSAKWIKNSTGMANCLALAVKQQTASPYICNNAGVIYVGSHGRGIWSAGNSFNINTAVQNVAAPEPASESLLVYPSPMTTEGNIKYELSAADNVTISIYDMQGREVKTINMGTQSPGSHLVTFESSGLRVGTYFAALTGTNFRKVSKFMVVK